MSNLIFIYPNILVILKWTKISPDISAGTWSFLQGLFCGDQWLFGCKYQSPRIYVSVFKSRHSAPPSQNSRCDFFWWAYNSGSLQNTRRSRHTAWWDEQYLVTLFLHLDEYYMDKFSCRQRLGVTHDETVILCCSFPSTLFQLGCSENLNFPF